ncbi:hypothetical protein IJF91_03425 [Candidatus Saccharibacteria bacterium]|nr:hypothetical protein [Candidatus Saccharibacteria bacterium]
MDQSNDDLQNAINGIVNAGGANAPEAAAPAAGAEMPDLGVPPMPPVPEAGASLDMALPGVQPEAVPEAPVPEPGADLMNQAPASIEEQAAAEAAPENAPAPEMTAPEATVSEAMPEAAPAPEATPEISGDLASVRQSMIQDLIPLMDKVSLGADKKFGLYKEVLDTTHDKNMVPAAYEVVKGMEDDTARAEALSYLLNESE